VTAPLDEGIHFLEAFNELMRTTNPALEAGAAELDRLGDSLGQTQSTLSLGLDYLASELDGLQQGTLAEETAAVKSCQELGQAATEAKAPLDDLEKDAAAAQEHWVQAFQEQASALDAAVKDAEASGWEPLDGSLAGKRDDFDKWAKASDSALGELLQLLNKFDTDLDQERDRVVEAAHHVAEAGPFGDDFWIGSEQEAARVLDMAIPRLQDEEVRPIVEDIHTLHDELVTGLGQSSTQVQARLDFIAEQAANAVNAQETEVTQALENTGQVLGRAQTEFERAAIQGEETGTEAQALAELAGQVAEAQVQAQQILAVMEAMDQ
jgi:hypothetical protein